MRHLNRQPETCCYVGDSAEDIEMGKRANLRTIGIFSHYPGSQNLADSNPELCIESINEILGHFVSLT
jgi:phosphoglycolate phosphatase-like HAD superfamily hydrolase